MPRLTRAVPKYRKHRATGQAIVTIGRQAHYPMGATSRAISATASSPNTWPPVATSDGWSGSSNGPLPMNWWGRKRGRPFPWWKGSERDAPLLPSGGGPNGPRIG